MTDAAAPSTAPASPPKSVVAFMSEVEVLALMQSHASDVEATVQALRAKYGVPEAHARQAVRFLSTSQ